MIFTYLIGAFLIENLLNENEKSELGVSNNNDRKVSSLEDLIGK